MPENPHELFAREKKAEALALAINRLCPAVDLPLLETLQASSPFWKAASVAAKVMPPSPATCALALQKLAKIRGVDKLIQHELAPGVVIEFGVRKEKP